MRNPCCCMSVRTGALVVGILEIIIYGLWSLGVGVTIGGFMAARSANETALETLWNKTQVEANIHPDMHVDLDGVIMMMSLTLALCLMLCAVGIVCVVGVKKIVTCIYTLVAISGLVAVAALKEKLKNEIINNQNFDKEQGDAAVTITIVSLVILAVLCLGGLICSALLVHGILKQKPKLTIPWLIIAGISIAFLILNIFFQGSMVDVLQTCFSTSIHIWFWLIVYSYKKVVEAGGDGKEDGQC